MGQEAGRLSRRDLFKVGTAAGAALLQPSLVCIASREGGRGSQAERGRFGPGSADAEEPAIAFPTSLRPSKSKRPNVVLIVLDTVRADHLSSYGYRRETTPNIDAFAAGARRYKNVLSPDCYTLPSHASFFTGLSASAHGASWLHRHLDDRFPTLAEQLAASGYQTVGLSANTFFVTPKCGFDRGFQTFWNSGDIHTSATAMHNRLAGWFTEKYDSQKPFFLFINYMDAHAPYRPPRESLQFASAEAWQWWQSNDQFRLMYDFMLTGADFLSSKDIAELESLYDDELRYLDGKVGQLLAFFKSTGFDENTLVLITSDHGEHFGEHHLMEHQYSLYEPLVRVPLIARYRDRFEAGEEERLVQSHDVYPTILEIAGLGWKPAPGQTCQSLLRPPSAVRYGISEHLVPAQGPLERVSLAYRKADCARFSVRLRAIQRENMKLIRPSEGELELYDLASDPAETRNFAEKKPGVTGELAEALDAWVRSFPHYVAQPMPRNAPNETPSANELTSMRGLGYVQ